MPRDGEKGSVQGDPQLYQEDWGKASPKGSYARPTSRCLSSMREQKGAGASITQAKSILT